MACLEYGFNQLGYQEVFARVGGENEGSNHFLRKLGFTCIESFEKSTPFSVISIVSSGLNCFLCQKKV